MNTPEQAYFYADLIIRRLKNGLTDLEERQLQEWLSRDPANAEWMRSLENETSLREEMEFFASLDTIKAWNHILAEAPPRTGLLQMILAKWHYAAVLVVALVAGLVLWSSRTQTLPEIAGLAPQKFKNDLPPGRSRATLLFADGSAISLEDAEKGSLAKPRTLPRTTGTGNKLAYNTISTPRGGEYRVLLPDGSKVWLNSSSSLSYPGAFNGKERKVQLTGEAYFEVAKNKQRPFIVMAGEVEVRVLGTHFNVKAYREEHRVSTTLLEGSVKVRKGNNTRLLVPGQELLILESGVEQLTSHLTSKAPEEVLFKEANLESAVAWKNGEFLFNNDDIQTVMLQVARWYDAEISYGAGVPDVHFSGKISRYNHISKVLNLLELTGGVHFKVDGKKVTVTK